MAELISKRERARDWKREKPRERDKTGGWRGGRLAERRIEEAHVCRQRFESESLLMLASSLAGASDVAQALLDRGSGDNRRVANM